MKDNCSQRNMAHTESSAGKASSRRESSFFPATFIQPKLTINQPNDIYEQEADAVAEKVMRMPVQNQEQPFFQSRPLSVTPVQRKCSSCEQEEKLQRKEEEVDESIRLKPLKDFSIQRKCAHCDEEEKLQMKEASTAAGGMTAPSIVNNVINSPGQSLDKGTRSFMESRFGYDFGNVQIHDDGAAHQSAYEINALAYTYRDHVIFGERQYQPTTNSGKELLAHELTHVIQQDGTSIRRKEDNQCKTLTPLSFFQNAPNYCMDDAGTGLLHGEGEVCFREFPMKRKDYRDCPPGHHICFDKKTGKCKEEHIDKVSPVAYKKKDGTCKLDFQCGLEHAKKDAVLEGFAKKYHIDPDVKLPGEETSGVQDEVHARYLNQIEIGEAKKIFGNGLDYNKVRVTDSVPFMSAGGYARTPYNTVYFPSGTLNKNNSIYFAFLIHELTHTWQTQHGISVFTKIRYSLSSSNYDFGGDAGLQKAISQNRCFNDFNTEAQASILESYYEILQGLKPGEISLYQYFLFQVQQNNGNCLNVKKYKNAGNGKYEKTGDSNVTLPGEGELRNTDLF